MQVHVVWHAKHRHQLEDRRMMAEQVVNSTSRRPVRRKNLASSDNSMGSAKRRLGNASVSPLPSTAPCAPSPKIVGARRWGGFRHGDGRRHDAAIRCSTPPPWV